MTDIVERLREVDNYPDKIVRQRILEAAGEIEKMRVELAEYIAQAERGHQTMVAEACELRKETHKLRAALKPFADMAEMPGNFDNGKDHTIVVTVGDLRAAKAALGGEVK